MFLLDDTSIRGSNAQGSPQQGDSFGNDAPRRTGAGSPSANKNFDGVAYPLQRVPQPPPQPQRETQQAQVARPTTSSEPDNYDSQNAGSQIDPDTDPYPSMNSSNSIGSQTESYDSVNAGLTPDLQTESYPSVNPAGAPSVFDDQYRSANQERFADPEFRQSQQQNGGFSIDEAKKMMGRAKAQLAKRPTKLAGEKLLGNKFAFRDGSLENREQVKDLAKEKANTYFKDKIGNQLGGQVKKGFEKGAQKITKDTVKGAAKQAGKAIGKEIAKEGTEAVAKAGVKALAQGGTKALQGAITAAGGATGAASFGLGFLLSAMLNIAISLGVNDAVEAAFELSAGNFKQAFFLAVRAAMRVMMFLILLIDFGLVFSVGGIVLGFPLLIALNLYIALGWAFPKIPQLQGFNKWMTFVVALLDLWVMLLILAFIGGLMYIVCDKSGISGQSIQAWAIYAAAKSPIGVLYSWITGADIYTAMLEICKAVGK